jgi:hypothetical protein
MFHIKRKQGGMKGMSATSRAIPELRGDARRAADLGWTRVFQPVGSALRDLQRVATAKAPSIDGYCESEEERAPKV